ncbi:proline racemase family protein [Novispirillum itersonii]|uniref:proline racemase family protein n=1 Tax=Novispirillum itersonii TaxID=189 RepID=UPI000381B1EB|nr:proline racemase family protein [Novispirillum itersonii]
MPPGLPSALTLPVDWPQRFETVEMHTGGEPVRIVTTGYPDIPGDTLLAKRRYVQTHLDAYRRFLMLEPRGHADMYGVIPVRPDLPGADLAVLFMHNEGYSTMCGHATLAVARWAVDSGQVQKQDGVTRVGLQCPCGLVEVSVAVKNGRAGAAWFDSVPAFAAALDVVVTVPGYGPVTLDIGYGGAFYAILPAQRLGLTMDAGVAALTDAAWAVAEAARAQVPLSYPDTSHPDSGDLAFLYGTILTDGADLWSEQPTRNICIFAERQVDRSPTGSGVTARLALQHARGQITAGQVRHFRSITGSDFTGSVVATSVLGGVPAVTARVGGQGHYAGRCEFVLEAGDALGAGFRVL